MLDLGPQPAFEPSVSLMPGARAVEAFVPVDADTLEKAMQRYPSDMGVSVMPVEHGLRVRFTHPDTDLLLATHRSGRHLLLLFGPASESHRLRALANDLQRPIPMPDELGAQLELWQDAERATGSGKLELALKLWEKLAEDPLLRDLARLRAAELFVISGHIEEALHQLREVSRNHPRSTGAALARLTALHLEAITGEGDPSPAQVVIAATSGSRHRFHAFTWLRAAAVLRELDHSDLALHHFPRPDQITGDGAVAARASRDALVEAALGRQIARGDHIAVITRFEAWDREIEEHPRADTLRAHAAESYATLGLHDRAIPLLRAQLSGATEIDKAAEDAREALVVNALARAYAATGVTELDHLRAVVAYQVKTHPKAPAVADRLRALVLVERAAAATDDDPQLGVSAAWSRADALIKLTRDPALRRAAVAAQVDVAQAWGTPEQVVNALQRLDALGFDDPARRETEFAVALARAGRHAEAEPRLRAVIARTTDPERRDEMAYLLAEVDAATDRDDDANAILRALAGHETRWGRVARARLRERALHDVVDALERRNAAALAAPTPPSPPTARG